MEACVVICNANKTEKTKGRILFIDAKDKVTRKNAESYLEPIHIQEIIKAYNEFKDVNSFASVATIEEIEKNNCMLTIQLYVKKQALQEVASLNEAFSAWEESSSKVHEAINQLNGLLQDEV